MVPPRIKDGCLPKMRGLSGAFMISLIKELSQKTLISKGKQNREEARFGQDLRGDPSNLLPVKTKESPVQLVRKVILTCQF